MNYFIDFIHFGYRKKLKEANNKIGKLIFKRDSWGLSLSSQYSLVEFTNKNTCFVL